MCSSVMIKVVGLTAAAAIIGFFIGRRFARKLVFQPRPDILKSILYQAGDPILKYVIDHSQRLHPCQQKLLKITQSQPEYEMMGAPEVVQLNMNLMKLINAKKVLDIGVFTGYSALGAALILPENGKVIACDIDEEGVKLGRPIWKEAGVEEKIQVHIQPALTTLRELIDAGEAGSFDFAFIDADKEFVNDYYEKCMTLVRHGGLISIDNTLWGGDVLNEDSTDEETQAIRALNIKLLNDPRINISFLTIGDGLTLVFKR